MRTHRHSHAQKILHCYRRWMENAHGNYKFTKLTIFAKIIRCTFKQTLFLITHTCTHTCTQRTHARVHTHMHTTHTHTCTHMHTTHTHAHNTHTCTQHTHTHTHTPRARARALRHTLWIFVSVKFRLAVCVFSKFIIKSTGRIIISKNLSPWPHYQIITIATPTTAAITATRNHFFFVFVFVFVFVGFFFTNKN